MNEPFLIEARGLKKIYSTQAEELEIFSNLEMHVPRGATAAITGPSGSGKSTLLSILGGLDRASAGTIRIGEYQVDSLSERRLVEYRAKFVGFVFQFHYLLKDFTALENVALPAHMQGESRKSAQARASVLLADMGLGDRLSHLPSQLSGGERQRAAIARALINRPSLILADEPTGNLDAANAQVVQELLFGLPKRYGSTLVLVTHDPGMAARADLRFTLDRGRLVAP